MRFQAVLSILFFSAHAFAQSAPPATRVPAQPEPAQSAQSIYQRNGGSLLKATMTTAIEPNRAKMADVSFFAVPEPEPRTLKKHDLITIIVREESAFTSKGTTDLKKEHAMEAKLEEFIKLKLSNFAIQGGGQGANPPSIKYSTQRDFKGEAEVDRTDKFTLRVTAEIVDVKPNGTVVLQARKHIKTDDEEQEILLNGICAADQIAPDNTILSTQLHDLDITKSHKGAVRDTTKRGWLPKLLDAINPF